MKSITWCAFFLVLVWFQPEAVADDSANTPGTGAISVVNAAASEPIDVRVSDMGGTGDATFKAGHASVAFNSTDNEYLVVWSGDDNEGLLIDDEFEIFGQLLDGTTGAEIGANDFRISDMGGTGNTTYNAGGASVVYNPTEHEFLVVWGGDDSAGSLADEEREIFGQRLDADTGAEIGNNDFRISDMGADGDRENGARGPRVAYNSSDNEYLVVWWGDENSGGLVTGEMEIFGQLLSGTGVQIGANDFRISVMGGTGDIAYPALDSSVVYNSTNNEYLVVWSGQDNNGGLVDDEGEIFGQRLSAAGAKIGTDNFRISDMGGTGNKNYGAGCPDVAYDSILNQYLVVWQGTDDVGGLISGERETFGQLLDGATGVEVGNNDFRISDMGGTGDTSYKSRCPSVSYNSVDREYLVVWSGDDNVGGLIDGEDEVFGQWLDSAGEEIRANDFRISFMGGTGDAAYQGNLSALVYNSTINGHLVVWSGDDNVGGLVDDEFEIYAKWSTLIFSDGFGTGNTSAWSQTGPDPCDHSLCDTGTALDPDCDTCVAQICAIDDYCCSEQWDRTCVDQIESVCGLTCPFCVHDFCETGSALDPQCHSCVEQICSVDDYCCNTLWDRSCVDLVPTTCGLTCDGEGFGHGGVEYSAAENTALTQSSVSLTIAGHTLTVDPDANLSSMFVDGFESGDSSARSKALPKDRSINCRKSEPWKGF